MARTVDKDLHDERCQQILDAALAAFSERGFAGASVADICKRAGMSPGHLYHYFPSKEDIIAAIAAEDREPASAIFDRLGEEDDLLEGILALLSPHADMGEFKLDGTLAFDVFAEAARNDKVRASIRCFYLHINKRLSELIEAQQEKKRLPKSIDPQGASLAITTIFEGLFNVGVVYNEDELARAYPSIKAMIAAVLQGQGDFEDHRAVRTQKNQKK